MVASFCHLDGHRSTLQFLSLPWPSSLPLHAPLLISAWTSTIRYTRSIYAMLWSWSIPRPVQFQGMGMVPLDLTQNGITTDGEILYVLDIPSQLQKLRLLLPDRQFYIYERDLSNPKGKLRQLW